MVSQCDEQQALKLGVSDVNRRGFLQGVLAVLALRPLARALPQTLPAPQTYTYKSAGACGIKADVYGADPAARKPAVLWIHGGALILGSRKSLLRRFHEPLLQSGYIVVSIDYRLAPETKLPAIIKDIEDGYHWTRETGAKLLGIDPDRLVVSGGSAGGYLTEMVGFSVKPRPRALVSFWGYGGITAPWARTPSAFYRQQPVVTKEEAYSSVGTAVLSETEEKQRGQFYLYCRQHGLWSKEVSGHDPDVDARWFDTYSPVRNVTAHYPPMLLIHGTKDTDVPYDESRGMAEELAKAGVEHQFITVPGAGHGLSGAKPEEVSMAMDRAVEFVRLHTA
jgi:acetyl esterase/lipase